MALALWGFGYLLADWLIGKRAFDDIFRWAMALPALVAFSLCLMLLHIASSGAVLSSSLIVRGSTLVIAAALLARKLRTGRRGRPSAYARQKRVFVGLVAFGVAVWSFPVFFSLPLWYEGDTATHAVWIGQLMNGETTPSALITGAVPNYYPWLFHALSAFTARFTPGGHALHTLGPLQMLFVAGNVAGLFALGRAISGRWPAGAFTALFGALTGGVGWIAAHGIHLVTDPRNYGGRAAVRYAGDLLLVRSYNIGFHDLAPAYPRDLTYLLLPVLLLLLLTGLSRSSLRAFGAAGVVLGLLGLLGGEAFMAGFATCGLVALMARGARVKALAAAWAPGLFLFGLWAGPVLYNYRRFVGFADITVVDPVTLPWWAILGAWGIVTPLAVYGGVRWLPDRVRSPEAGVLFAFAVSATALVAVASFGADTVGGFKTLFRPHRYWPLLFLAVALLAGAGAAHLYRRLRGWEPRRLAVVRWAVVCLAVASPIVAGLALPPLDPDGPLAEAATGDPGALFNLMRAPQGRQCVIAVPDEALAREAAAYTGYRLVSVLGRVDRPTNAARIRWADIYERIPRDAERARANHTLTHGLGPPARWHRLVKQYGVDFLGVPLSRLDAPVFHGLPVRRAESGDIAVVRVGGCEP
ncbi:hypothetical protein BH18ACT15_BH18ACT15_14690 [soil metagenome]